MAHNIEHLGIYPSPAALHHDAAVYARQAIDKLRSAGVDEDLATNAIRKALKEIKS